MRNFPLENHKTTETFTSYVTSNANRFQSIAPAEPSAEIARIYFLSRRAGEEEPKSKEDHDGRRGQGKYGGKIQIVGLVLSRGIAIANADGEEEYAKDDQRWCPPVLRNYPEKVAQSQCDDRACPTK